MSLRVLILGLFLSFLSASEIKVALSANVSFAIDELKEEFNRLYPDIKVGVTIGSTGKLTAQVEHGASYHIFMGANMDYPNRLYKDGFAITKPTVYAKGSLAYLSVKKRDFSKGMELLKDKDIKKIAVANPKTAPYGIITKEALKSAKIYDEIKDKFVYGESISQTVIYALKATDIGIVAKSALFSPKLSKFKENENWADVNSTLYTPISQGIVILKEGKDNKDVLAFYNFILSDKAKEIFKKFGYQ